MWIYTANKPHTQVLLRLSMSERGGPSYKMDTGIKGEISALSPVRFQHKVMLIFFV